MSLQFLFNGCRREIICSDPRLSLYEWIRRQPDAKGTKSMCCEGGCGACVVSVTTFDPIEKQMSTKAVNSCLFPLLAVQDSSVTTTEGIGSSARGFHPIQERLADYNGSQCGFCAPGFVMNAYSLLKENSRPSKQNIEDAFVGHLCRCTGYRPILNAMHSFTAEENPIDIEDCSELPCLSSEAFPKPSSSQKEIRFETAVWLNPTSVEECIGLLSRYSQSAVRLVAGNTGTGVYKDLPQPFAYVSLQYVSELHFIEESDTGLTVGSGVTLTQLMKVLRSLSSKAGGEKFCQLANHIEMIAGVPVQNRATWVGGLVMANEHGFLSDMVTILQAARATLLIRNNCGSQSCDLENFLKLDLTAKLVVSLTIPYEKEDERYCTYKVMPRHGNAHAYVNAAFSWIAGHETEFVIVYGGLARHSFRTRETENYLKGKSLQSSDVFRGALNVLENELLKITCSALPYKSNLALSLFYKFYLSLLQSSLSSERLLSAAGGIARSISHGSEKFQDHPSKYPLTKPMPKVSAKLQTSGEAQFVDDLPIYPDEVHGAFILSTQGNAEIKAMDFSDVLKQPGVLRVVTKDDIPGVNNWKTDPWKPEPVFVDSDVDYAGQPMAIVIADTQAHADRAAQAAKVVYESKGRLVLTIKEAIEKGQLFENIPDVVFGEGNQEDVLKACEHVLEGEVSGGEQRAFYMETQRSLAIPVEDGFDVYCSTQNATGCQRAAANVVGLKHNSINTFVRRLGGGFGGKDYYSCYLAATSVLASHVMKRPVRIVLNLDSDMEIFGGRNPFLIQYKVGFNSEGILKCVIENAYFDSGFFENGNLSSIYIVFDNAYYCPYWRVKRVGCKTNAPSNTTVRGPYRIEGIYVMECIIERIANFLGKSSHEIRLANFYKKGDMIPFNQPVPYCSISSLWKQLLQTSDYDVRKAQVKKFNKQNRWKKKGISVVPMKYGVERSLWRFSAHVAVYSEDGSIAVTIGGIEMGQGIHTKVMQVAASTLGLEDLSLIKIKPTAAMTAPNNSPTTASVGSELNCAAVIDCCSQLNERLKAAREKLSPDALWPEIVKKAYQMEIDLSAKAWIDGKFDKLFQYFSYGVACTEVEVDILTGEHEILRTDILQDCGTSMNPAIDVGQVQGAFVMGLGHWLSEEIRRDSQTGRLLTKNTWEYKPPGPKDIPIDFRIELLKDAPNPLGVLGSKAVGEPSICLACTALFAIQDALASAREEIGNKDFFHLNGTMTVKRIHKSALVDSSQFYI